MGNGYVQDAVIELKCNEGYMVNGTALATCTRGQWTTLPRCELGKICHFDITSYRQYQVLCTPYKPLNLVVC